MVSFLPPFTCAVLILVLSVTASHAVHGLQCSWTDNPWKAQIHQDFAPHLQKNLSERMSLSTRMFAAVNNTVGMILSIRDNEIFFRNLGQAYAERERAVMPHLALIVQKALSCFTLPDVDLFFYTASDHCRTGLPTLGWNKHIGDACILFPWAQFLWDNREYVESVPVPWKTRTDKAIFRGATTGGPETPCDSVRWRERPRIHTALFCRNHTHLCDARLTSVVQCPGNVEDIIKKELPLAPSMSWREEQQYRHILLLDGNGAPASRSAKAYAGGFTVLRHETPYVEFFYSALRPWVHYVPISFSLSDLKTQLEWVKAHPRVAEEIAENALAFSKRYFTDYSISCYVSAIVSQYAKMLPPESLFSRDAIAAEFARFRGTVSDAEIAYLEGRTVGKYRKMCTPLFRKSE